MKSPFSIQQIALDWRPQKPGKRPFVFIHGNTQNDTCGKAIKDYFLGHGHSTLSYDLPGHGDSPLQQTNYQFSDLVDLNFDILHKLNLDNPILCGHSLGGMIQAATIARYKLKQSSLILCGSYDSNPIESARHQQQHSQASNIADSLQQYIEDGFKLFTKQFKYDYFKNNHISDLEADIINRRYTHPQANANNLNSLKGFDVRMELKDLAIPILLLHGEQEEVIPAELIQKMLRHYDNIEVGWYPQLGHYAFYQNPQLTEKYLTQHYPMIA